MKDALGTEVEVGDIVVSSASGPSVRIGKVYGFDKNGWAKVISKSKAYNLTTRQHEVCWYRGVAGPSVIVLSKHGETEGTYTPELLDDEIFRDYDREVPK